MTGGHIFSIQVRSETFHKTEGVGLTSATAVMGQPLGWNTQSAHWSKAKFNMSWEEEMKTSIVPAWKHKGNLGVEWNQAMWNFTSMRGIKSLALEKRVFKCDDTSLRRYLQDNVFAVAPFPQGSHANSLEATESPLPQRMLCCWQGSRAWTYLSVCPHLSFVVESSWLPHAMQWHQKTSPLVKVCSLQSALHERSTFTPLPLCWVLIRSGPSAVDQPF